ncbi:hypothetical protein [Motilibacter aurantiacus]|uniref:hypothetical protein n=1 Tax=Motilibacter aurantiacus TaxID=2714955 RepID=UPI001408EF3D|nr:hypothetical protein [Motilibacter aurantiacus]NHC46913.1 hypothetical protein [Motilibacter aurantiacus]
MMQLQELARIHLEELRREAAAQRRVTGARQARGGTRGARKPVWPGHLLGRHWVPTRPA